MIDTEKEKNSKIIRKKYEWHFQNMKTGISKNNWKMGS